MNILPPTSGTFANTDSYNDLNALQSIKTEDNRDEALKQVAQQFESLFVHMMLKGMRSANAVFEEGNMMNSQESKFFRDMHDQQLSLNLTKGRGIGIADVLYRQLKEGQTIQREQEYQPINRSSKTTPDSHLPIGKVISSSVSPTSDSLLNNEPLITETYSGSSLGKRAAIAASPQEFIQQLSPYAEMAAKELGVDKNILLAQSALETGWGKYVLADQHGSSNNLFNIKASADWHGDKVTIHSLEHKNGVFSKDLSNFKKYQDIAQSFSDYVNLIKGQARYSEAINRAEEPADYIEAIHKAGYATDPDYAEKVLNIYHRIQKSDSVPDGRLDKALALTKTGRASL